MLIGVISDTHGLLRPEALAALRGVNRIIHAGDIGAPEILTALAAIAPVTAVRGNNDEGSWALAVPPTQVVDTDGVLVYVIHDIAELDVDPRAGGFGVLVYVIHDIAELDVDPRAGGFGVVVAGHSHRPRNELRDGVLWFNPGSAGPRRFNLPIAIGRLTIEAGRASGEIVILE